MAPSPWPEEIDMFTIPHNRMKQLVTETSEKLITTDFADSLALKGLLSTLSSTFHEFQHHEEIENKFIMRKLMRRLSNKKLMEIVREVHSDNHVAEMLSLVESGLYCSDSETSSYKRKLESALQSFTRGFLPHMKHEEEFFQPLLVEHFSYEELKSIKNSVIQMHEMLCKVQCEQNPDFQTICALDLDLNCQKHNLRTFADSESESDKSLLPRGKTLLNIKDIPTELIIKIMGYVSPKDLCRCAQVCWDWSRLARDGQLWQDVYPVRWIHKGDWRFGLEEINPCACEDVINYQPLMMRSSYVDEDADEDESGDSDDGVKDSDVLGREMGCMMGMSRYLIPIIGPSVRILIMSCFPVITSGMAYKILSKCPNLEHLDLSQTLVSDLGIRGLFRHQGGSKLRHLDLSGCAKITDKTLINLAKALAVHTVTDNVSDIEGSFDYCRVCPSNKCGNKSEMQNHLEYLALSGCFMITDKGLRALASNGGLPKLRYLDLSGCLKLTDSGLSDLTVVCPELEHSTFFYCDNITEGPFPDTASGCQNLQSKNRVCCRLGE